ncbi:hypothetical protein KP509_18G011300 [Ceratopteris richardii]|uniref:Uncharacterized protein n=3 Tax=Ceratopteris richardii TaxID=49495 RepID=A0A8T2SQT8_CERRI|nr:hypothetical protein KP509_18G011300 [Ceratopteris richardii]
MKQHMRCFQGWLKVNHGRILCIVDMWKEELMDSTLPPVLLYSKMRGKCPLFAWALPLPNRRSSQIIAENMLLCNQ